MAKVIIGGQMLSLVLALLVTPVFYALLDMVDEPHPAAGHPILGRDPSFRGVARRRISPPGARATATGSTR